MINQVFLSMSAKLTATASAASSPGERHLHQDMTSSNW
jgi:hypothetical protein